MTSIPSMDRKTRLPRTISLTSLTRRYRLTRTASLDRPTRMAKLDRPAKMPRLNWPAGYTINATTADGRCRKQKADPRLPKITDSIRNFPILPLRGVPWGVVGFRGAVRGGAH